MISLSYKIQLTSYLTAVEFIQPVDLLLMDTSDQTQLEYQMHSHQMAKRNNNKFIKYGWALRLLTDFKIVNQETA